MRKFIYLVGTILFFIFNESTAQNFISYTIPTQNQIYVSRDEHIIVGFNETMNDTSLNNNSIVVFGTLSGRHYGDISYDTINNKVTYTPQKYFAPGEKVFVSLTNEIKNDSGISLSPTLSLEFNVKSDTGSNNISVTKSQNITGLYNIEDMKVMDVDDDGDFDLVFSNH